MQIKTLNILGFSEATLTMVFDILDELERLLKLSKQQKLAQLKEFETEFEAVISFKTTAAI